MGALCCSEGEGQTARSAGVPGRGDRPCTRDASIAKVPDAEVEVTRQAKGQEAWEPKALPQAAMGATIEETELGVDCGGISQKAVLGAPHPRSSGWGIAAVALGPRATIV
mmetsp:Transcript_87881/g.246824  ORF Transcript_87881/g.246824 Transcript_87881/m.246824 type:complete len:110 (-) Transcript_87881:32-361(-)